MKDRDQGNVNPQFRRNRLFAASVVPLLFASACRDAVVTAPKKTATVYSQFSNDDLTRYSPQELERGQIVRQDLMDVFTEFVPDYYLNQGMFLRGDGHGYWAEHTRGQKLYEGEYFFDESAKMGQDGQEYSASVSYDQNWKLTRVHLRAGNVPAYITPDKLPENVPDFTWLSIPADSLQRVAEMAYNLPPGLNWQRSVSQERRYMSSGPEEEIVRLEATGNTPDGRSLRFGINQQSFSSLNVSLSPKKK